MATETSSRETSPAVSLFQKAHGRMQSLQRIDEQLSGLLDQRRKIQDELRTIQSSINEEFDRVMKAAAELPGKVLSQIAEAGQGNGHASAPRAELAEALS